MARVKQQTIEADERGTLSEDALSIEQRTAMFRDAFEPLLRQGHKWDAILLGLAEQFRDDRRNLDYGRLLGSLEVFQGTYDMACDILEAVAHRVIVLDERGRKQEPDDDACDEK